MQNDIGAKIVLTLVFLSLLTILPIYAENAEEKYGTIESVNVNENQPISTGEWIASVTREGGIISGGIVVASDGSSTSTYVYEGAEDSKIKVSCANYMLIDKSFLTIEEQVKATKKPFTTLLLDKNKQTIFEVTEQQKLLITFIDKENRITVKKLFKNDIKIPASGK